MAHDPTEMARRAALADINTDPKHRTRETLEAAYGEENVWDTAELRQHFTVQAFAAPYVVATRKSDGAEGSLEFTHRPRFYFNWRAR